MKNIYMSPFILGIASFVALAHVEPGIAFAEGSVEVAEQSEGRPTGQELPADPVLDTEAKVPKALSGLDGIKSTGTILGMDSFVSDGTNLVWLVNPDGSVISGYPFDENGMSLHPNHQGDPEINLEGYIRDSNEIAIEIPESLYPDIDAAISALGDAEKQKAVNELILVLREVEGEEAFKKAIDTWAANLSVSSGEKGQEAPTTPASVSEAGVDTSGMEMPASEGLVEAAGDDKGQVESQDRAGAVEIAMKPHTLLGAMRSAFTLGLGPQDAPRVVMIMDPNSSASRIAWSALSKYARDGDIRLEVAFVAAENEDSAGAIAAVLMSEDIPAALDALSASMDQPAPIARYTDLGEELIARLRQNFDIMRAFNVPAVPLVAFTSKAGERYMIGTPSADQIGDAAR